MATICIIAVHVPYQLCGKWIVRTGTLHVYYHDFHPDEVHPSHPRGKGLIIY
jgi:hypothetical protein